MKFWIARDYNGELWLYDHKPVIDDLNFMFIYRGDDICKTSELNGDLFPEVTFENSPKPVEIVIKEE